MKSVLMMVSANVRKRKAQSLLILSTIMMASFLLTTAVGVLDNLNSPFEQMYEGQNGSHITMQLPPGFHDPDQIVGWWETQDNVLGVQRFPYLLVNDKIGHNDVTKSMGGLMITEHPGLALTQDRLVIVDGVEKSGPDVGEVWVPTGYAYAWGIEVNDVLEITINGVGQAMSVSAIVVDPQFSIGMMNPIRVWVKEGTLALSKDSPDKGLLIAVRLSDHLQQYLLWPDFEAALGTPFLGFLFDYAFIGYSYSMVESIIGAIMLLFSGIIILVSVCVIYFTISNAIITDFKTIGILKTQGFSAVQVKKLYVLQYMLLALVAIPLGILTSSPVTGAVLSQMVRSLGLSRLDASLTLPATVTVVTIGAVVLAATHVSARRAGLIKPADAIRNKPPASKGVGNRHLGLTRISVLPVSLLLALKSTQSEKRHSILMVAATAIMAFVVVFSVNAYNSVSRLDQNYAWWGFDDSDVYVSPESSYMDYEPDQLLEMLHAHDGVEAVVAQGVILTAIAAQGQEESQNVVAFVYRGDMDSIGILNLEGKSPTRENEVSLSVLSAQKYSKTVGDMVELYIEGQKSSYLVTGIYQSLNNGGRGFRLQENAVRAVNPDFSAGNISIKLKPGVDPATFVSEMRLNLQPNLNIRTAQESGELNLSGVTENMALLAALLSGIFMVVAFIITFNATLMNIYSDKKSFGIYKALGLTPLQIRMSLVWKALLLAAIGATMGGPLSLALSPRLLSALVLNVGLVKFPFDVTPWGTLLAIPVCLGVAILSVWIPSGRILGFSPRNLIIE